MYLQCRCQRYILKFENGTFFENCDWTSENRKHCQTTWYWHRAFMIRDNLITSICLVESWVNKRRSEYLIFTFDGFILQQTLWFIVHTAVSVNVGASIAKFKSSASWETIHFPGNDILSAYCNPEPWVQRYSWEIIEYVN